MSDSLSLPALARSVWGDFLRARRPLIIYEIFFKFAEAWLLIPAVAFLLAAVLSRAGRVAVSNLDILEFLLTPHGLLYAALFSTLAVGVLLLEQAGIMVVVAGTTAMTRPPLLQLVRPALARFLRIVLLGAFQAAILALALAPFVLLAAVTYFALLTEHDIYFYWKERPPEFWLAAAIGGILLLAAMAVCAWLLVRWAFALPIVLFENQSARAALRASRERVRGVAWRVGLVLFGWAAFVLLLGALAEAGFRDFAANLLDDAGERPIARILLLLFLRGVLLAALSFLLVVGLGLLTRQLYLQRSASLGLSPTSLGEQAARAQKPISPWNWRLALLFLVLSLLSPLILWATLWLQVTDRKPVLVTAHRGHARAAPENTLSAMRKAIASGADYAEMDVQLTADGKIVLLHDRDLKRVAGVSRRLDELTYDEVRRLDVGSWFAPAFSGERVPTLAEVIDLCRGKMRLNIELKFYGPDRGLTRQVADLIREKDFESECIVTSLNDDALRQAKRHNPRLRTGLIVAHALGDVSRLEFDALSVRADFLSNELLRSARRHGREVHAWTVNDPRQMMQLMKRGVDNIITSDPDLAVRARDEWSGLTQSERLVLASRLWLELDP
jgi:glycerophosphoryl diester phosphodiesterase